MMKKCLTFILITTFLIGVLRMETYAAEEKFLTTIPAFRLSLVNDEESMMYTAYYAQDYFENTYLLSSAFVGAAMEDGWTATLHTSSGEKKVEHLLTEHGVSYLKAEIPKEYAPLKVADVDTATYLLGGDLIHLKGNDESDESTNVKYVWAKYDIDFLDWLHENGYYLNEDLIYQEAYLNEVKQYGAPIVQKYGEDTFLLGAMHVDESYHPIIRDFRVVQLSTSGSIGKVEKIVENINETSDVTESYVEETNDSEKKNAINTNEIAEDEAQDIIEVEDQKNSELNYFPLVAAGIVVIVTALYFKKKK